MAPGPGPPPGPRLAPLPEHFSAGFYAAEGDSVSARTMRYPSGIPSRTLVRTSDSPGFVTDRRPGRSI